MSDTPAPQKLAAALQDAGHGARTVAASGRGSVGELIIASAHRHGVPVEYAPPLAQALAAVELDADPPEALYLAMVEILGFLLAASDPN
jgi:flagellar biosynthesis protein